MFSMMYLKKLDCVHTTTDKIKSWYIQFQFIASSKMYAFLLFTDQQRSLLSRRPKQVCDAGLQIYCIVYGQ